MKKIVLLTAILALMLAAGASVKASPAQLCECEQTKGLISITNAGEGAFYSLELAAAGGSAASGFVEKSVFVESRSTLNVPYWLSSCELGETFATLTAQSKDELQSIDIPVSVGTCKKLGLSVEKPKLVCAGESAEYKITVSNLGKKAVKGVVQTDLNAAYDISGEAFEIAPLSNAQAKLVVHAPKDAGVGQTEFLVKAVSGGAAIESIQKMVVSDCTKSEVGIPAQIQAYSLEDVLVNATVFNKGKFNETFRLEFLCPSFVTPSAYSVFVEKNSSRQVKLLISPKGDAGGQNNFDCAIIAIAQNGERFSNSTKITVLPNSGATISSDADAATACVGEEIAVNYTITNAGRSQALFEYSVKGISAALSAQNASIPSGTSGRVRLIVGTGKMPAGDYDYEVSAKSGKTLAVREFALSLIDCDSALDFRVKPVGAWEEGKLNELKASIDNRLYNISNAKIAINSSAYFEPSGLMNLTKGEAVEKTFYVLAEKSGKTLFEAVLNTSEFNLTERFNATVANSTFQIKAVGVKKANESYQVELELFNKAGATNAVVGFAGQNATKVFVGANSTIGLKINSSALGLLKADTNRGAYAIMVEEPQGEKPGFFTGLFSAANLTLERGIVLLFILLFVFLVFLYRGKKIIDAGRKKTEGPYYG